MTNRIVITDDVTGLEIPPGDDYFNVYIRYVETDTTYNTFMAKTINADTVAWTNVTDYLANGIPATSTEVTIVKRTA